jgi:hypothetical protein
MENTKRRKINLAKLKLTGEPFKKTAPAQGWPFGRKQWFVPTSKGDVLLDVLAKELELKPQGLLRRIKLEGFDSDLILRKSCGGGWTSQKREIAQIRKEKQLKKYEYGDVPTIPDEDIGKYEHLSDRPRGFRLNKIKIGSKEKIWLKKEEEKQERKIKPIKLTKTGKRRAWRKPRPLEQVNVRG